jgi:hypothetical protein
MSTMTVESGQLNVSASASPAAQSVSLNSNNLVIANIVLDASQSGEDVRLNALPIIISATGTAPVLASNTFSLENNLTNCQLFNGSTALNSTAIGSSQWASKADAGTGGQLSTSAIEANFVFDNSLTVPKGTSVTLSLVCNVGGSLYNGEQFSAGVDSGSTPTVTGATSGNTITVTPVPSTSGTMTIGTATLVATVPTPLSYAQVAGGTQNVTVGTFTLQPSSGNVSLQNIGLKLNSNNASSSDIANGIVSIWQGSTQIGTVNFSGKTPVGTSYFATSTIAGTNINQNVQTTFTLKASISPIGVGQSGTSGHEILVGLADANGTSGSSQVDSGAATQPSHGNGVAIFESTPTIAASSILPTSGVADGRLIAFSVTANANGGVGINQFVFNISTSTGITTLTTPTLYAYSDSGFSVPAGGTANGGIAGTTNYNGVTNVATSTMSTPLEVAAGTTEYFLLRATAVAVSGTSYNISTTLKGDSTDLAPIMSTAASLQSGNDFIWSPNSTTTSATTNVDWTNGYGVVGLPSIGLTENRTQ